MFSAGDMGMIKHVLCPPRHLPTPNAKAGSYCLSEGKARACSHSPVTSFLAAAALCLFPHKPSLRPHTAASVPAGKGAKTSANHPRPAAYHKPCRTAAPRPRTLSPPARECNSLTRQKGSARTPLASRDRWYSPPSPEPPRRGSRGRYSRTPSSLRGPQGRLGERRVYLRGPLLLPVFHLVAGWIPVVRHGVWVALQNFASGLGSRVSSTAAEIRDFRLRHSAPPLAPPPRQGRHLIGRLSSRRNGIGSQVGAGLRSRDSWRGEAGER